jgi:hypothetical protein
MVEILLVVCLIEEVLCAVWLVGESERDLMRAMTEQMVEKTRKLRLEGGR